jgi:nucleoside-diphosphate-sugar epimerase
MAAARRDWAGAPALVTGGEGFIGTHLVERLLTGGADVRILARHDARRHAAAEVVVGDVTLPTTLTQAVRGREIIFHCAAAGGGTLATARSVNVAGTHSLLDAAARSGVRRVVHLSSVAVHGPALPERVAEEFPRVTRGTPYAISKVEGEAVALSFHASRALEVVVIRPTCVYGPASPTWVLAPLGRVRDEQAVLVDAGRGLINLVYVDDLVDCLLLGAAEPTADGEVFIANGAPITWAEYLGAFARMLHKPPPASVSLSTARAMAEAYQWRFRFTRRSGRLLGADIRAQTMRTVFDAAKARRQLGWTARVGFAEGMRLTEAWLRETGYLPAPRRLELAS